MSRSEASSSRKTSAESSKSSHSSMSMSHTEFGDASATKPPFKLESIDTFVLLGFAKVAADAIWGRYISQPDDMDRGVMKRNWMAFHKAGILDFALWAIHDPMVADADDSSDDWYSCMDRLGIGERLKTAIMLKEYEDLRYTATCKYWLKDAVQNVYDHLKHLNDEPAATPAKISRLSKSKSRKQPTPYTQPFDDIEEEPSTSERLEIANESAGRTIPEVATSIGAPSAMELHTSIWRSGSRLKAQAFYNEVTGAIDPAAMITSPGDFNLSQRSIAYWTPQRETALRYAKWARYKNPVVDIALIQVSVPEALMRRLTVSHIWFSDEWKTVVWCGRNMRFLPPKLAELEEKDVLIGHIASGKHVKYVNMKDPTEIQERDVLTVTIASEETKGIQ